jgi:hypothetical protein
MALHAWPVSVGWEKIWRTLLLGRATIQSTKFLSRGQRHTNGVARAVGEDQVLNSGNEKSILTADFPRLVLILSCLGRSVLDLCADALAYKRPSASAVGG